MCKNKQIDFDRLFLGGWGIKSMSDLRSDSAIARMLGIPRRFLAKYKSGEVGLSTRVQTRIFDILGYKNRKNDLYRFIPAPRQSSIEERNRTTAEK